MLPVLSNGDITPLLNQVWHCDALELLRCLPDESIHGIITDMPYGSLSHIGWDKIVDLDAMWHEVKRVLIHKGVVVSTASQPFTSILVTSNLSWFRCEWIWRKPQGTGYLNANRQPMKNHESVIVFARGEHNYYPQMREGESYSATRGAVGGFVRDKSVGGYITINEGSRYPLTVIEFDNDKGLHPTQKPLDLFAYLIETYTRPDDIVLDCFCGSGTTAVAARKLGRRFICGDITEEYVTLARTRLANTDPFQHSTLPDGSKQLSLFEGTEG